MLAATKTNAVIVYTTRVCVCLCLCIHVRMCVRATSTTRPRVGMRHANVTPKIQMLELTLEKASSRLYTTIATDYHNVPSSMYTCKHMVATHGGSTIWMW